MNTEKITALKNRIAMYKGNVQCKLELDAMNRILNRIERPTYDSDADLTEMDTYPEFGETTPSIGNYLSKIERINRSSGNSPAANQHLLDSLYADLSDDDRDELVVLQFRLRSLMS